MNRIVVEEKIPIPSECFNGDIKQNIYKKVCERFEKKCFKEYGYVVKVYDNIQIGDNTLSTHSSVCYFNVNFTIKTLKPEPNKKYEGIITIVIPNGIFLEIEGIMKVLVPLAKLEGYTYKDSSFISSNKKVLKKGMTLTVIMDKIRFENNKFDCIGSLKDN